MKYPRDRAQDNGWSSAGRPVVSPEGLLEFSVDLVRSAADLARRMREDGVSDVSTKSTETDVVTAADRAVERFVVEAIRAARPQDAVLGEEFGRANPVAPAPGGVQWILDPIDGTVNYLYDLPVSAVSLAARIDDRIVTGVVRNITTGAEWVASLGRGAFADGRRLCGSKQTVLSQALVATGFGYDARVRAAQARVVAGLLPQVRDIRRWGAASIDLCLAAEGKVDAYFERGLNLWDHAAGGLIAAEAGLIVSGLRGANSGSGLVLAAPPVLHGLLHDQLVRFDADGAI